MRLHSINASSRTLTLPKAASLAWSRVGLDHEKAKERALTSPTSALALRLIGMSAMFRGSR